MELDDNAAILSSTEFFEICDAEQRRLLAFASERRFFSEGESLYRSGETPAGAHILVAGVVEAQEDGARPFEISTIGALIGAMGLLLAKPRAVNMVARTDAETLFVPRAAFRKLLLQSPDLTQRAATRIEREVGSYLRAIQPIKQKMTPS